MASWSDRILMACLLVVPLLAACGEDGGSAPEPATIELRALRTDLLRGASLCLYEDGRALLMLSHIGGGTNWFGTWTQQDDVLSVLLPRMQESLIEWKPGRTNDPPDELSLRRSGSDTWIEERRTFASHVDLRLTWTLIHTEQVSRRQADRECRFETKEKHDAFWFPDNAFPERPKRD